MHSAEEGHGPKPVPAGDHPDQGAQIGPLHLQGEATHKRVVFFGKTHFSKSLKIKELMSYIILKLAKFG